MSNATTEPVLKRCPFCQQQVRAVPIQGAGYSLVGCHDLNCPASSISCYPDEWNARADSVAPTVDECELCDRPVGENPVCLDCYNIQAGAWEESQKQLAAAASLAAPKDEATLNLYGVGGQLYTFIHETRNDLSHVGNRPHMAQWAQELLDAIVAHDKEVEVIAQRVTEECKAELAAAKPSGAAIEAAIEIVNAVWEKAVNLDGDEIAPIIQRHFPSAAASPVAPLDEATMEWALRELADGWITNNEREGPHGFYQNARKVLNAIANGLVLHCSCGAACTPTEYAEHQAMGHDVGDGKANDY